jgi:CheY-like chemotaxis protein
MAKKILIVDDDSIFAELYQERLIIAGYEVVHQLRSDLALKTALEIKPDLILLDLMMPIMSGEEVFKQLKANKETENIPVFILTALLGNSKIREFLAKEADGYIVKSEIVPKDLVDMIAKKLK